MQKRIWAGFLGFGVALFLGEFSVRAFQRELFSTSNLIERTLKIKKGYSIHSPFDTELGWSPPRSEVTIKSQLFSMGLGGPSFRVFRVSTDLAYRATPNAWNVPLDQERLVVTLGDSFTFGGEVSDEETWSSHLQAITKSRVLNAGVSVFGLDQSLIRLRKILNDYNPKIVILSVIRESILRTERKKQILSGNGEWVNRPYFIKRGDQLELQNVPVGQNREQMPITGIRSWLGRSHLANALFSRLAFYWWYDVNWGGPIPSQYLTGEDPKEISCLLLRSYLELSKQHHFQLVVLGQYYDQDPYKPFQSEPLTQEVLQCAKNLGIFTIDLEDKLRDLAQKSPEEYNTLYFPGAHMTNRGNWWVAQQVAGAIR
jgi:hypothetical protein